MTDDPPPTLAGEIGKVAWFIGKGCAVIAVFLATFYWLFHNYPVAGTWVFCGLVIVGQVLFLGWQNYKWKKESWASRLKAEEAQREFERKLEQLR